VTAAEFCGQGKAPETPIIRAYTNPWSGDLQGADPLFGTCSRR
jgi:hypothetical protein